MGVREFTACVQQYEECSVYLHAMLRYTHRGGSVKLPCLHEGNYGPNKNDPSMLQKILKFIDISCSFFGSYFLHLKDALNNSRE